MNSNLSLPHNAILWCAVMLAGTLYGQEHHSPTTTQRLCIDRAIDQEQPTERTPVRIVYHGTHPLLATIAHEIADTLNRSDLVNASCSMSADFPRHKIDISKESTAGNPFVLYLTMEATEELLHGRLYNTLETVMIMGKQWSRRPTITLQARAVADDVWKTIFAMPSPFLSSIAYVQRNTNKRGVVESELRITAWDGSEARTIASRPTIILAPLIIDPDQVIFSEFTPTNVRLMKTDRQRIRIILDRPGTTVGVSGSLDTGIIYCKSGVIWRYTFDADGHRGIHEPIITEEQPCACPLLLHTGDVLYCTQGRIKRWSAQSGTSTTLISGSGCTAPTVCEHTNRIIYARRSHGTLQLFSANLTDGSDEQQLTTSAGDKMDPALSPCGTAIVYCHTQGKKSGIYLMHLATKKITPITEATDYCLCPTWSS